MEMTDDVGAVIRLPHSPVRIISLVPSLTELLSDLGLEEEVVGLTKFCVHPKSWRTSKTIVGGTKNIHIDRIQKLKPDLVIANKEENNKDDVDEIRKICPVWTTDISTLPEAILSIYKLGELLNRREKAFRLNSEIEQAFANPLPNVGKAAYCIWKDPWMFAGQGTFIHDLMTWAGWSNVISGHRYPTHSLDELKALGVNHVLLSSEPYPFSHKHLAEVGHLVAPANVHLVDGEMFSWYGSRLIKSARYLTDLNKKMTSGDV